MTNGDQTAKLEAALSIVESVFVSLDRRGDRCECCSRSVARNVPHHFAAQSLESAATRIRRAIAALNPVEDRR